MLVHQMFMTSRRDTFTDYSFNW